MHASEVTPEVIERANELYWTTDRSVNGLAEELDLSKGALYGAIIPLTSGLGCPLCGDEVGYANRTARDREHLECATCGWDGSPHETTTYDADETADAEEVERRERTPPVRRGPDEVVRAAAGDPPPAPASDPRPRPLLSPPLDSIAKGALVGGAIGLALVLLVRRR